MEEIPVFLSIDSENNSHISLKDPMIKQVTLIVSIPVIMPVSELTECVRLGVGKKANEILSKYLFI